VAFDACKVSMLLTINSLPHSKQTRCQIRLCQCLCGFCRIELLLCFNLAGLDYLRFYLQSVKRTNSELPKLYVRNDICLPIYLSRWVRCGVCCLRQEKADCMRTFIT